MKAQIKRVVALMLAITMMVSLVGCSLFDTTPKTTEEAIQSTIELQQAQQNMEMSAPTEYDKNDMKDIVELLGGSSEDAKNMNKDQLNQYVENLIQNSQGGGSKPSTKPGENDAEVNVGEKDEFYDESGAMTKPFDQIYPEIVAEGGVAFDEETLLIKMSNSRDGEITKAMSEAGISVLEAVVPMEKSTWYEAKLFPGADAVTAVKMLRELKEIQMVDFNYVIETNGMADSQLIPEELVKTDKVNNQWHLKYCQYPQGHGQIKKKGGDPSVIVAVIDTGVDYDHEDLSQNIWKNTAEIPDNGIDDDKNGYIDDYYGVNIITKKGNGDDDHGHGTHVAGIIAAQNNNIGVVGLAYNVKIMPIKAGMASGSFNQSDIAKAVLYAYEHGAQVINMSFGGSACSIAVQDALEVAYSRCVLVASAGNDTYINEPIMMCPLPVVPNYPAALSYVIGVMSVGQSGVESGFTNIDGILYTKSEYEVYAPGEGILSTIPNNEYASWSGTSMAAPIVSAIAAIVRSEYPDHNVYTTKFIYGQLTSTSSNSAICGSPTLHGDHNVPAIINLYEALTKLPTPDVGLYDWALFDTIGFEQDEAEINNGDGVIDAGETIALGLTLRNRWGKSKDTMVKIDTLSPTGIPDPYITIINPEVNYGEIGTYSTADSGAVFEDDMLVAWENPFYIHISEDCPNDYIFRINVTITAENGLDEKDKNTYTSKGAMELEVRSGTELPSIIEEDMTLTKDNLWIVPNGTTILAGATVTVEPGTHIQFWSNDPKDPYADQYIAGIDVKGRLLVNGTAEEKVYIYPSELMSKYNVEIKQTENGYVSLNYADITNFGKYNNAGEIAKADHCIFRQNYHYIYERYLSDGSVYDGYVYLTYVIIDSATNCVFYKCGSQLGPSYGLELLGEYDNCIFADCDIRSGEIYDQRIRNCVFLGNNMDSDINPSSNGVSSYTVVSYDPFNLTKPENYDLYYDKFSGTTYLRYYDVNATDHEYILERVKEAGGDYAVVNTEEERKTLEKFDIFWNIWPAYDEIDDCYLWHDGTPIQDFADPDGVRYGHKTEQISFYKTLSSSPYSSSGYLYEIPGPVYPEEIGLDGYSVLIGTNNVYQINASSYPATDEFIYESDNTAVALVDENGLVTPVAPGTANITVYSFDKAVYNYVTVNVVENYETVDVYTNEKYQFTPQFTPVAQNVTYQSTDENVVTVDENGLLTPVAAGTADVYIRSTDNGLYYRSVITVKPYSEDKYIGINETYQIAPQFTPADADIKYALDGDAVTVTADGLVTPVKEGTAVITVSDANSPRYYTINIDVGMPVADIYTNETYQITQSLTDKALLYTSADETIATVDENGLITPVTAGETTVYVYIADETADDITDNQLLFTVDVKVTQYYYLESITLYVSDSSLQPGESGISGVSGYPSNATDKGTVTFTSSDDSVVAVDEKGNYTAISRGKATITAVSSFGFTDKAEITVYKPTTSLAIDKDVITASVADGYIDLPTVTYDNGTDIQPYWVSTDENVAKVDGNRVKLLSEGTTTLVLTDGYTDLTDSVLLYVLEGEVPVFVKVKDNGNYSFVLTDDGRLYRWDYIGNGGIASLYAENVVDFDTNNYSAESAVMILSDGTLLNVGDSAKEFFKDKNPVKIKRIEHSSYAVLTAEGYLYTWGDNEYGQLGLGHKEYVSEPTLVNIEGIRDIVADTSYTMCILLENGDVYMTGGNGKRYTLPTLTRTDIIALSQYSYSSVAVTSKNKTYNSWGESSFEWKYTDFTDYDLIAVDSSEGLVVKDGKLYKVYYASEPQYIPMSADITAIYTYNSREYVVATADGMLYTYDGTDFYLVDTFVLENDSLYLKDTNLGSNGVLSARDLVLTFNKEIKNCNITLYANDSQIPVTVKTYINKVILSRSAGFESGVNYKAVINSITGSANTALEQPLEIRFTYGSAATPEDTVTEVISGSCGENATFTLDSAGTLTINGSGAMKDYAYIERAGEVAPWRDYVDDVKKVVISDGITSIGDYTFTFCKSLTDVEIPDDVTRIGNGAFHTCCGLKNINIPEDLEYIGEFAFYHCCEALTEISIPDSVTFLGRESFDTCRALESVTLSENITDINSYSFWGCTSLKSIVIPSQVKTIGKKAFYNCSSLETIELSSEVTSVAESAFAKCDELDTVYFNGTEEQWNSIDIAQYNDGILNANKEYVSAVSFALPRAVVYATLIENTVDETVSHDSQTVQDLMDSRFYWSEELFMEQVDQAYNNQPYNPRFNGNVVLNRVSTDTRVENWLRVVAPTSSYYMEVPLGGIYWGTTNENLIAKQIVDYSDYNSYARVLWEKYLTEAPENVFPFVDDVTILDKNGEETRKVGAEEITVKVSFNRDMDTSIPLRVTFGSAYPYADYTIEGSYTDPRTWQGTYTVSTLIEGGTSYFNFANGMSATDNLMLCEDTARFAFDIDNTAAQALIMQGYATDTGIQLSWTQDDFTTLMGYNVYRSTAEDGLYQRVNSTVIPADTKEFFDDTVEPGVQYYYNFTVVKTDMNESVPSGKITLMSKDTMAPNVYHSPVYSAFTGSNLIISATVTDNLSLTSVKAYYRTKGAENWNVAVMSKLNDKYSAIIPANDLSLEGLEYYIEAFDGINYTYKGSQEAPYAVTIQEAVDASSLGDVNGDGKIATIDALMLLQAINDKLNLTADQFKRADLDGNGELQAFEALRIIQYVNGTVGSVQM